MDQGFDFCLVQDLGQVIWSGEVGGGDPPKRSIKLKSTSGGPPPQGSEPSLRLLQIWWMGGKDWCLLVFLGIPLEFSS